MTEELQELEPLEEPTPTAAAAAEPADPAAAAGPAPIGSGLAAPAYNPAADTQYYRFLLSGIVMFIGCLMPFGPEWEMAGYKTLGGAFAMWVAIGMIWSWWGAISTNRFRGANLKWVGLALFPLIFGLVNMMGAFAHEGDAYMNPAVGDFVRAGRIPAEWGWGDFFAAFFDFKNPVAQNQAGDFVRAFGAGKFVVFIGAVLAELFMLTAIFSGAKHAKAQKAAVAAKPRRR
ncbi:MAG: hypothetical protein ACO4CT_14975 [Planctomycetota bacterium]|jgi:hypothetical protein